MFVRKTGYVDIAIILFLLQRVFWPRGTGIGGSSNLNAMIYQRGNPNDYDNWANITGNPEWRFENVLRYFKKLEDYHGSFPSGKKISKNSKF